MGSNRCTGLIELGGWVGGVSVYKVYQDTFHATSTSISRNEYENSKFKKRFKIFRVRLLVIDPRLSEDSSCTSVLVLIDSIPPVPPRVQDQAFAGGPGFYCEGRRCVATATSPSENSCEYSRTVQFSSYYL